MARIGHGFPGHLRDEHRLLGPTNCNELRRLVLHAHHRRLCFLEHGKQHLHVSVDHQSLVAMSANESGARNLAPLMATPFVRRDYRTNFI